MNGYPKNSKVTWVTSIGLGNFLEFWVQRCQLHRNGILRVPNSQKAIKGVNEWIPVIRTVFVSTLNKILKISTYILCTRIVISRYLLKSIEIQNACTKMTNKIELCFK